MEVVIGHKGKCGHEVEVKGLGCHSGQAPLGINAINYASKIISFISDYQMKNQKKVLLIMIMKYLTLPFILVLFQVEQ